MAKSSTTLSIRVPKETKRWLEQFSKNRGSAGSAVSLLLEEAKRQEVFRAVNFRDTPKGRLAYVQGTRLQVFFVWLAARDFKFNAEKIAKHFELPLWKIESALAYAGAYREEIQRDLKEYEETDFDSLKRLLPSIKLSHIKA